VGVPWGVEQIPNETINTGVLKPNNQMEHTLPAWQQSVNRGLLIGEPCCLSSTQCLAWQKEQTKSPYADNLCGDHASLYGTQAQLNAGGMRGCASAWHWPCPLGSPLACPLGCPLGGWTTTGKGGEGDRRSTAGS